ncbi:hypothetical protein [Elizabethkingia miricola]|uniref:hypothetical protein n=1 Tax=Elizabethkingia miricola TaxID=172045 RepID=UPI000B358971|nr:hypothetical protein [Elizabethkingia miricola]
MNFKDFEDKTGFYLLQKDILLDNNDFVSINEVVKINSVWVRFWGEQWKELTGKTEYRIEVELSLFGGESKFIVLYHSIKTIEDLEKYFSSIFYKIKIQN